MSDAAARDREHLAARVAADVLAPLVLGGAVKPGKPIGARSALALGLERDAIGFDPDVAFRIGRQRLRVARELVPVDHLPEADAAVWTMGAAFHDLLQVVNPTLRSTFRPRLPLRLAALTDGTLDRVAAPKSVADALARHTWFARLFALQRTDTTLRWWSGSASFVGQPPPARLFTWKELRRVESREVRRTLAELPLGVDEALDGPFSGLVGRLLSRTPLTDLATLVRPQPQFVWTTTALSLIATSAGRRIALRALDRMPMAAVDAALGRATRALVEARASRALSAAAALLGERALARAVYDQAPAAARGAADDATFARALGALVARRKLRADAAFLPASRATRVAALLDEEADFGALGDAPALLPSA